MRLAVNGYFLGLPYTGTGQYTLQLLRELASLWVGEIMVYHPRRKDRGGFKTAGYSTIDSLNSESNTGRIILRPIDMPWLGGNLEKVWFEQVALPFALKVDNPQLLHIPYLGPPLLSPCSTVVTVHDLIPIAFPQSQLSPLAKLYFTLAVTGAKRASAIIADSRHTKNDILTHLKTEPDKVKVIHLAADERYRPGIPEEIKVRVREKYGLDGDYILYLGGLDRRKNVTALIKAFAQIEGPWQLAVAGEPLSRKRGNFPDLKELAKDVGASERVKFIGWVSEEEKPALYAGASLFIYPSLYEGFGLPPLEAMACGTPVLASNSTSIPEVVGDAALLFDPSDINGLAELMEGALNDRGLRQTLVEKGLHRASIFSWRKTAQETLDVYLGVLKNDITAKVRAG